MPIFEFLCRSCNRIYSFLSLKLQADSKPICPRCGETDLTRVPSSFALAASNKSNKAPRSENLTGGDDSAASSQMEQEIMQMADNLDEKDMEDPRTMARVMRRMMDASGEPINATMGEMLKRMEAGEDPETLEEELGPQLEEEMGGEDGATAVPSRDDGLYSM